MRSVIVTSIAALALAGCQARAVDARHDEAIFAAVEAVMCARDDNGRTEAVRSLASEVESYRPFGEGDSAGDAIEVGLQAYEEEGCSGAARSKRSN